MIISAGISVLLQILSFVEIQSFISTIYMHLTARRRPLLPAKVHSRPLHRYQMPPHSWAELAPNGIWY